MMFLTAVALAGCLSVQPRADRIVAGDLLAAFSALAELPAATPIAPAPAPGVVRVFGLSELHMLAARFHVTPPAAGFCVARPVSPLTPQRLLDAMLHAIPGAAIEILEHSRLPAPDGEIEFPRGQLQSSPAGALWTGFVRYAANRRFTIWARVKISVPAERVVAKADLPAGKPISAAAVEVVRRDEFPAAAAFATTTEDVIGRLPRLLIRAGTAIRASQLENPKEVLRGDTVTVEVHDGRASLKLEAEAEAAGAIGQFISVRNPTSGKRFRARVEAKGLVSVNASPGNPKVNP